MNPLLLIGIAAGAFVLFSKSKSYADKETTASTSDSDAIKKAQADSEDARMKSEAAIAEAEKAKAEAEKAKSDAETASKIQPFKDAVIYTAGRMGKEPFRVQTVSAYFNGKPIGPSIVYGVSNSKATRSDYEAAIYMLQSERQQRMVKGLPFREEILALKKALAAYAAQLFGSITLMPDAEEKVTASPKSPGLPGVTDECKETRGILYPFNYATGSINGQAIGPWAWKYTFESPTAKKIDFEFVQKTLAGEQLMRMAKGEPAHAEIGKLLECLKAERVRRFGS